MHVPPILYPPPGTIPSPVQRNVPLALFSIRSRALSLCPCIVTFRLQVQTVKCAPPLLSIRSWESLLCLLNVTFRHISGENEAASSSFTGTSGRGSALERSPTSWLIWLEAWTRTSCPVKTQVYQHA